jgi:hypothetical protein
VQPAQVRLYPLAGVVAAEQGPVGADHELVMHLDTALGRDAAHRLIAEEQRDERHPVPQEPQEMPAQQRHRYQDQQQVVGRDRDSAPDHHAGDQQQVHERHHHQRPGPPAELEPRLNPGHPHALLQADLKRQQ